MTYAESKNKSFNWAEFLGKSKYTFYELLDAEKKACSWVNCAVGNQCESIPREPANGLSQVLVPVDEKLKQLGTDFHIFIHYMAQDFAATDSVSEYNREQAINCLMKIEKRSAEILRNLNKNEKEI